MNQRRFVLIVAVSRYADSSIPRLPGVQRDAERLRMTLEQYADGGLHRILFLCDGKATKEAILKTLREIANQAGATDQVVVYFAGHGWRDRDTDAQNWTYYLIPYDATFASATQAIAMDDLHAMLSTIHAQELVLILDCCHSGGMANTHYSSDVSDELLQGWRSHYVMAASRGYEQAGEDDVGGFFTNALCDALRGEGVTPDEVGRISVQKAWSQAADLSKARAAQRGHQQVAVSSGISTPIYITRIRRDLVAKESTGCACASPQEGFAASSEPAARFAENRRKVYAYLWRRLEEAHLRIRTDDLQQEEFSALLLRVNTYILKNSAYLENADHELANKYLKLLQKFRELVVEAGQGEVERDLATTACIDPSALAQASEARKVFETVNCIRGELLNRVKRVLRGREPS